MIFNFIQTAIEYYESREDPKFREYQNNLNLLLSQPEILKKIGRNSSFNQNIIKDADPQKIIKQVKVYLFSKQKEN